MDGLLEFLATVSPGHLPEDNGLDRVLAACWHRFSGSGGTAIQGYKRLGRMEQVRWEPPSCRSSSNDTAVPFEARLGPNFNSGKSISNAAQLASRKLGVGNWRLCQRGFRPGRWRRRSLDHH